MKYRLERVNELIRRELGEIIARELTFPGLLVTVQNVDVTPDLKNAHVFVSMIGDKEKYRPALTKLGGHRSELQRLLSKRVILKFTPHLHFRLDESIERGVRVNKILDELDIPKELNIPDES